MKTHTENANERFINGDMNYVATDIRIFSHECSENIARPRRRQLFHPIKSMAFLSKQDIQSHTRVTIYQTAPFSLLQSTSSSSLCISYFHRPCLFALAF